MVWHWAAELLFVVVVLLCRAGCNDRRYDSENGEDVRSYGIPQRDLFPVFFT